MHPKYHCNRLVLFYEPGQYAINNSITNLTAASTNTTSKLSSQQHVILRDCNNQVRGFLDRTENSVVYPNDPNTYGIVTFVITVNMYQCIEQYSATFSYSMSGTSLPPDDEVLTLTHVRGNRTFRKVRYVSTPGVGNPNIILY